MQLEPYVEKSRRAIISSSVSPLDRSFAQAKLDNPNQASDHYHTADIIVVVQASLIEEDEFYR